MLERKALPWVEAAVLPAEGAALRLESDVRRGLSSAEAAKRLRDMGGNEIPRQEVSALAILRRQFRSPFTWLLLAAAAIALFTGEALDAGMITLFTAINAALGFTQEYRAERAVHELLRYWEDRTHVVRSGIMLRVAARDLVPGDVVRLQAGDRLPADVRFLRTRDLSVDESVLTGESVQAPKDAVPAAHAPADYFEAHNIGFFGTVVVAGEADAIVIATGADASLGEIAALTGTVRTASAFESEIARFSAFILRLVIATLAVMFALNVGIKGLGHVEELVLFTIALTVGVIPEALPVVSTIALSRGAARMAKKHVVVKRLSAIDDLGSIDVLCTDKTGTITENALAVDAVRATDEDACALYAVLGSSFIGERDRQQNNAFDLALWKHATRGQRSAAAHARKIAEIPFDPVRRLNASLVEHAGVQTAVLRGAPEEVLARCARPHDELALGKWIAEHGLAGDRVLAIAAKQAGEESALHDKNGFRFLGLIAFRDPIKRSSYAAVHKAARLGVQIKILTGDSREVAGAVAARLGIIEDARHAITGAEFDALSATEKLAALDRFHVFARVNPAQKFEVLSLLKEKHVVGFLGEGFNDAPGLKIAHVGLAVEGASDIAREAADVILLNKSLGVIFDGIEEGRRTFANTIKYVKITLASNFGNFYAVAVASFFIPFLPMLPLQILLLNLLTDVPMIAIAADRVDTADLRNPGKYDARRIIIVSSVLGGVSSAFDFGTFALFRQFGEGYLQSAWFMVSALTELALIHSLRTMRPFWKASPPPLSIILLSVAAAVGAVALPFSAFGQRVFHFAAPRPEHLVIAFTIVVAYFVATETVKRWIHRHVDTNGNGHAHRAAMAK